MNSIPVPPPPLRPTGPWLRLSEAAQRIGLPVDLLRSELSVGRCQVRAAKVGKRDLVMLASNDVDALAARMAAGVGP